MNKTISRKMRINTLFSFFLIITILSAPMIASAESNGDAAKLVPVLMLLLDDKEAVNQATIAINNNQISPNESIQISLTNLSGFEDWVGIYPRGASNDWENVVTWVWANNTEVTLDGVPAGEYDARLFFNNSFDVESEVRFSVSENENAYEYGQLRGTTVVATPYSLDNKAVIYHPENWDVKPTPVIFFYPGFWNTNHLNYKQLLEFIADHGYSVVFLPDYKIASINATYNLYENILNEFADNFDTSKMGVLGHSSGGGYAFRVLEKMIKSKYGENGRLLFGMDMYFAQNMNKSNMQLLSDTNAVFIQFGPTGNSTDPRIPLVNYRLLSGENIDKNYIVLKNDNDHGYPARQDINTMQGMLKPLDALMEYTFTEETDAHHQMSLEGEGKIDPYANGYQKVESIEHYSRDNNRYGCIYAALYHSGPIGGASDIENCGEPVIEAN